MSMMNGARELSAMNGLDHVIDVRLADLRNAMCVLNVTDFKASDGSVISLREAQWARLWLSFCWKGIGPVQLVLLRDADLLFAPLAKPDVPDKPLAMLSLCPRRVLTEVSAGQRVDYAVAAIEGMHKLMSRRRERINTLTSSADRTGIAPSTKLDV